MRKKVLVLSGSPRKNGNSDMLCDAFVKGAEKAGHLTEKVFIQKIMDKQRGGYSVAVTGNQQHL